MPPPPPAPCTSLSSLFLTMSPCHTHTAPPTSADGPFGAGTAARVAEVLAELGGDGGFVPEDIELVQELGRVAWVVGENSGGGSGGGGGVPGGSRPTTAAVVYAARYAPPTPFQSPTPVLVKEYLPHAAPLAANELQVGARLSGGRLPLRKWHAAMAGRGGGGASPASPPPPTAPLLGWFRAAPADPDAAAAAVGWLTAGPRAGGSGAAADGSSDPASSLWLVFRWEAVQPLSFYPASAQEIIPPSPLAQLTRMLSGSGRGVGDQGRPIDLTTPALARRCLFLRAVAAGTLRALASVHAAGVAHGSLGGGGVLLSTYDDARAGTLRVCLDNFGFAQVRRVAGPALEEGEMGEDGGMSSSSDSEDEAGARRPPATRPPILSFGPGSPGYVPPPASSTAADDPVSAAQAADAVAAGRLLLEAVLASLPVEAPGLSTSSSDDEDGTMTRGGVPSPVIRAAGAALVSSHAGDAAGLAAAVRSDPSFAVADALLSAGGGAGYDLLARLAVGDARFGEVLRENWFVNGGRRGRG